MVRCHRAGVVLALLVVVLVRPGTGHAATYYVRQTVGDDTHDGSSPATAWQHLGIVPVLGAGDQQGGPDVQQGIDQVTGFVKDKGVGMLGFLPLGADRQCSGLLALTCLDANILPQVFALTDLFNNGLA